LGHQNRQSESHNKAREVIDANILGTVTLVEATTNRNTTWGAWVWEIHEDGNPDTIDWEQFQEPAPHRMGFSPERFFRWRCWYDYGTGLAGDLLSHEYDAVNQVLRCGIPHSAVASGGIYYFKDGRDVPDVFQVAYEYPERDMTVVYSATLANGANRGLKFMGHDGTMQVSSTLTVSADSDSTRYADKIKAGIIDPSRPMFTYRDGFRGIDAVTSATEQYFTSRGLLYTYRGGRRVHPRGGRAELQHRTRVRRSDHVPHGHPIVHGGPARRMGSRASPDRVVRLAPISPRCVGQDRWWRPPVPDRGRSSW
jgi:predicted dehydrogenase